MNKITTLAEYQQLASRTCKSLGSEQLDYMHMDLGIQTEIGETLDIFKRLFAYGKEIDLVNLAEELADQVWYRANYARLFCEYHTEDSFSKGIALGWETNVGLEKGIEMFKKDFERELVEGIKDENIVELLQSSLAMSLQDMPQHFKAVGIADVTVCYIICNHYNIDFWQALTNNINKLKVRYPENFTNEHALNRDLESERVVLEQ